jgi:hypothetical protein
MRTLGAAVGRAETIADALALAGVLAPGAPPPDPPPRTAPAPPPAKRTAETAAKTATVPKPSPPPPKPAAKKAAAKKTAVKNAPAKKTKAAPRDTLAQGDVEKVIAGLRAHPANRPADRSALERHIVPLLCNQVTLKVSHAVIKKLEERKVITFNGNKIGYTLPAGKK